MKRTRILALAITGIIAGSILTPATASAGSICNNGTYSSNSGRGTCSHNGGVNRSFPSYSDPGSTSYNRQFGLNNGFNSRRNSFSDPFASNSRRNSFSDPFASNSRRNSFSDPFRSSGSRW